MTALVFETRPQRLSLGVYRRRRLVALVAFVGLVIALVTLTARLGGVPHAASEPDLARAELVSRRVHVVQPGDTLWTIARVFQPVGDVRPLVQQLSQARRSAPLQLGERIAIPNAREVVSSQR